MLWKGKQMIRIQNYGFCMRLSSTNVSLWISTQPQCFFQNPVFSDWQECHHRTWQGRRQWGVQGVLSPPTFRKWGVRTTYLPMIDGGWKTWFLRTIISHLSWWPVWFGCQQLKLDTKEGRYPDVEVPAHNGTKVVVYEMTFTIYIGVIPLIALI